jgi:hypothetical protein
MFRNSRKEIKEWVFNIFLYKFLIPRKNQFATFISQLIVFKFLGGTRDLGLTVLAMHHAHDCSVINVVQYFYMRSSSLGIQGSH